MPGVTLLKLTETDTFVIRVYPRNEFVQTHRIKTFFDGLLLPYHRLGWTGSVETVSSCDFTTPNCKARTSSSGASGCDPGGSQIDQGRSLCVHHEDVRDSLVRWWLKPPHRDLGPGHFSTPKRLTSHPRGHPTIHLSKSTFQIITST